MIQDIAPYTYHVDYKPVPLDGTSQLLSYDNHNLLIKAGPDGIAYPTLADYPNVTDNDVTWLFELGGLQFFLLKKALFPAGDFSYKPVRMLRSAQPRYLAYAGVVGNTLNEWYTNHHFCGQCGAPMEHSDKERMVFCPHCHVPIYPRICPAVIVAVLNGDKILISKYAPSPDHKYSKAALIAGFNEAGESIEDTVHREVMEEVGLKVKNLRFYKSQPWGFSNSLLMGFYCEVDGSDEITVDHNELAAARWITRDQVPDDKEHCSLTMEMMTRFKEGKE